MPPKKTNRNIDEIVVNAAPGDDDAVMPRPPKNIGETKAWKASQRGISQVWDNYRETLIKAFREMNRSEQETLIQRLCVIMTVGVAGLVLLLFYGLIPRTARVFGVPALIFGAYWVGNKIVTPVVLARMDALLNLE